MPSTITYHNVKGEYYGKGCFVAGFYLCVRRFR